MTDFCLFCFSKFFSDFSDFEIEFDLIIGPEAVPSQELNPATLSGSLVLIMKWGGELTPLVRTVAAENLPGRNLGRRSVKYRCT